MRFGVTRQRFGAFLGSARTTLHSIDRAAMTAGRVFKAVKPVMPDSAIKKQMEQGVSSYEALRRKIKDGE